MSQASGAQLPLKGISYRVSFLSLSPPVSPHCSWKKSPRCHAGPHSSPRGPAQLSSAAPGHTRTPTLAPLASCFFTTPGLFPPRGTHFLFLVPGMLSPRPSRPSGPSPVAWDRPFPYLFSLSLPCCVPSRHVSLSKIISFIYKCLINLELSSWPCRIQTAFPSFPRS